MRDWVRVLAGDVLSWPGVTSHDHRFGGVEFRVGEREIGHVHNFGIVDIPFTVRIREALTRAGRAEQHHWLPKSGWTTVRVKEHGEENARALLRLSYLRIQVKDEDHLVAGLAQRELEALAIEPEVLAAVGVAVPAARS
jgi:hypothetical protein